MAAVVATGGARQARGSAPAALALALALIAGCAMLPPPPAEPAVSTSLPRTPPPAPRAPGDEMLPNGETLQHFYAGVEQDLIKGGRMRRDIAPADAPFSDADLVRDFVSVALNNEYTDMGRSFAHVEQPTLLRRWEAPIRVGVMTGASASPEDAARDRGNVAAFANRLAHLTGLDIALTEGPDANLVVLFVTSPERVHFVDELHRSFPNFTPAALSGLHDATIDNFCITYAFSDPARPSTYSGAIILIRAEHPAFTRLSCVQEEMSQAMGLLNDSPDARPSLYNDDLEFALLTEHDAMLLRMLYDPRLKPGMSAAEAGPLLPAIAADARAAEERDIGTAVAEN